ncbi:hypothetical protein IWQ62_001323 [Dispira parvispora]|uniref:Uncharacterized protein n=1 Tax=Dispira parvispora TaxID=1520584 RepID=A0A9W8AY49_9FUNG|nr:hypothetical protein IWQ62_001323 [Dispira parvispora]
MPPGTGPTAGNNSFSPLLHNSPPSNTSKTRAVSSSTANLLQSSLRNSTQMAYFVLSELVDKYREIPLLYEQAAVFSPILHNEACFRMADLALLVRWGGLSEDTLVRLVLRGASPSTLRHYEPVVQGRWKDPPATPLYRRITRGQVGAWILRGWNDEAISSLGLQEQLHLIQQMVCLFDRSGLQRKKGFFMYQLSVLLQQLVHPPDVKGSPSTKITGLGGGPTHTTVTSTLAVLDEMLAVYYLSRFYPTNAGPLSEGLLFDSQRLVKALQATVLSKIGRRHDKAGNKPTLSGSRLLYSQSHLWHALQDAVLSQSIQLCRNLGLVQPAIVYSLMLINLLWLYGNREPFSLLGTTDKMSLDMHLSQLAHQLHTMVLKLYSKYPPWFVSPRILSVRNTSKSSDHTLRCPSKLLSSSDSKAGWLFFQSTDINLPRLDSALLNGVPIVHDTFQRLLLRLVIRPSEDPARRCYPSIFNAEVREWYADFVQSTTTDRNVTTPEHAAANPFIYHAQTAAPTTKSALGGRRKSGHSMGPWHPRVPQGPCDEGEQWLVSKEPSDVTVELWNPFPFVLVVSDVALVAYRVTAPPATEPLSTEPSDTVLLSPLPSSQCPTSNKSCVISPGQTQVFRLPLQVEDQTQRVVVHGCVVKLFSHLQVHLVPEVEDPTFGTPDVKSGVGPEITHESHLVSKVTPLLVPDVIPPMPILTAVDSSFPDPNVALDLIEGETRTLSLTLHNGGHAPVNYLRWQFIGITMAGTKHVLRPKAVDMDLLDCSGRDQQSPLPIQYQGHTVGDSPSPHGIPVRRNNACNPRLDPEWLPGETRNLHFSVTAQTDYCRIEVQAEYGQVDRLALVVDHWYQRKFNFSLSLQVHPALVVTHFQLQHLPPRHLYRGLGIGLSNDTLLSCSLDNVAARTLAFVSQQSVDQSESTHGDPWSTETQDHWCLAQIDLRNPNNESVNIEVDITAKLSQYFPNLHGPSEQDSPCFHAKATCPPGETARLLLPVPRFQLPDTVTCQAIPVRLTHGEYVIQQTDKDQTTAQQTLTKALYWYRRALFTHLGLRWSTQRMDGQATGLLQVDRIPFSPSLLHILRGPDCLLMARLQSAVAPADHLDNVLEHRDGTAVCSVGQCVTLCVTIRNRSPVAQQGSLRVLPSIPRSPNQQLLGTTRLPLHGDTANGIHTTGTGDLSTQLPQVWATLNHEDGWSSTAEFLDEGVQWSHQSRYPLGMLAPGSTKSINVPFYFDLPGLYTLQYGWEQYSHANSRIMHQLQVQVVVPSSFCKGE